MIKTRTATIKALVEIIGLKLAGGMVPLLHAFTSDELERELLYVRNGFINGKMKAVYDNVYRDEERVSRPPSDIDIYVYDNWFYLHPDKICGIQYGSSSNSFPVMTQGKQSTIEAVIRYNLKKSKPIKSTDGQSDKEKKKIKMKAKAILIAMQL